VHHEHRRACTVAVARPAQRLLEHLSDCWCGEWHHAPTTAAPTRRPSSRACLRPLRTSTRRHPRRGCHQSGTGARDCGRGGGVPLSVDPRMALDDSPLGFVGSGAGTPMGHPVPVWRGLRPVVSPPGWDIANSVTPIAAVRCGLRPTTRCGAVPACSATGTGLAEEVAAPRPHLRGGCVERLRLPRERDTSRWGSSLLDPGWQPGPSMHLCRRRTAPGNTGSSTSSQTRPPRDGGPPHLGPEFLTDAASASVPPCRGRPGRLPDYQALCGVMKRPFDWRGAPRGPGGGGRGRSASAS